MKPEVACLLILQAVPPEGCALEAMPDFAMRDWAMQRLAAIGAISNGAWIYRQADFEHWLALFEELVAAELE